MRKYQNNSQLGHAPPHPTPKKMFASPVVRQKKLKYSKIISLPEEPFTSGWPC
jgi:hypothetical protein